MEFPRIKACFKVKTDGTETVYLLAEHARYRLKSRHYAALIPLLDGQRRSEELTALLAEQMSPAEVWYTLDRLEEKGFLEEAVPEVSNEIAAYWNTLGTSASVAAPALGSQPITVIASDPGIKKLFEEALKSAGLFLSPEGKLNLIVARDYLDDELRERAHLHWRQGQPCLLVKPFGLTPWLGPLYRSNKPGCHHCLNYRLGRNRQIQRAALPGVDTMTTALPGCTPTLPASLRLAADLAALELAKWVVLGSNDPIENGLYSLEPNGLQWRHHLLTPWPECPLCNLPAPEQPAEITLAAGPAHCREGGYRTRSPEATLAAYSHLVSPITGLVPALQDLPVTVAGPVFNVSSGISIGLYAEKNSGVPKAIYRGTTAGKGRTEAGARASALGEALERLAGIYRGSEPRVRASLEELGAAGLHPNTCMGFSQAQYADRETQNRRAGRTCFRVPEPFDPKHKIDWTPVWSLTHHQQRYLPTSLCYYHTPPEEPLTCRADSNGAAAGNTLEEAILQGLLELVERDSVAIWWYNRLSRPGVALETVTNPWIREVRNYYKAAKRRLWALDLTSDLGVPVYAAISAHTDPDREEIFYGFGAHGNGGIALERAISEANQFLPFLAAGPGQKARLMAADSEAAAWLNEANLREHAYLLPSNQVPRVPVANQHVGDLATAIDRILTRLHQDQLEVLVLDQTRTDIGMPVAKVFVPGLRGFWNRFAPGRLYDVPPRMGWLEKPTPEQNLNPWCIFF